ncbi:MAG: GBS Bsp-like repeat-containing protein [Oliverpabstia sp.]
MTDHSKNGYTITCDVSDNVGINKVLFPTWNDSEGTASAKWLEGTVSGGKATVRVNVSDWDNKEGIYYTDIYASDKSGNEACYSRITRYIDRTPPTISEVKVTSMDVDGYTVSCKVTDNKTMSRVQFPTWTRENDQDDLNPAWETDPKASGTKNGDYYTYRVNISDHNKEKGPYVTHIYAYDMSGNSTKCESLAQNE